MSNHYTYRAEWSPEDNEYVGLVAEFPSLSWLAPTAAEATAGATKLVDDILADMAETGEVPPAPFTERRYSGNLSVRTSPDQHRQLVIEAAEQRVSLNQWVVQKLSAPRHAAAAGIEAKLANISFDTSALDRVTEAYVGLFREQSHKFSEVLASSLNSANVLIDEQTGIGRLLVNPSAMDIAVSLGDYEEHHPVVDHGIETRRSEQH